MAELSIRALSEKIARTSPADRNSRGEVLHDLKLLRKRVLPQASQDRLNRLDAAVLLLEFMNGVEEGVSSEALGVVARLVATIDGGSPDEPVPATAESEEAESDSETPRFHSGDLEVTHSVLLGQILVETGIVSMNDVGQALKLQLSTRRPMGVCLIELGAATEGQIMTALQFQEGLRSGLDAPRRDDLSDVPEITLGASGTKPANRASDRLPPLRLTGQGHTYMRSLVEYLLGEIMIRLGSITRDQLDRAMTLQRGSGKFLGETLVETGAATWDQVKMALNHQRRYR